MPWTRRRPETSRAGPALWAALLPGIFSAALYLVPGLLAMLSPVPILLAWLRFGPGPGLRAGTAGGLAVAALQGMGAAPGGGLDAWLGAKVLPPVLGALLGYGLVAVLAAAILATAVARTRNGLRALLWAVPAYALGSGTVLLGLGAATEGGILGAVERQVSRSVDRALQDAEERSGEDARWTELVSEISARRGFYERQLKRFFPGAWVAAVALGMWINLVYSRWFLGGKGQDDDLCRFRMPMAPMYAFMACTAVVVAQVGPIGERLPRVEPLFGAALNGLLLLSVLYWLQGVAVLNWYFLRLRAGPVLRMAGVGAQAVFMAFPPTSVLYGGAGLADAWFDLRRLEPAGQDETGARR